MEGLIVAIYGTIIGCGIIAIDEYVCDLGELFDNIGDIICDKIWNPICSLLLKII